MEDGRVNICTPSQLKGGLQGRTQDYYLSFNMELLSSLSKQKGCVAGQEGVNSEVGGMKKKTPLATQGQRER